MDDDNLSMRDHIRASKLYGEKMDELSSTLKFSRENGNLTEMEKKVVYIIHSIIAANATNLIHKYNYWIEQFTAIYDSDNFDDDFNKFVNDNVGPYIVESANDAPEEMENQSDLGTTNSGSPDELLNRIMAIFAEVKQDINRAESRLNSIIELIKARK